MDFPPLRAPRTREDKKRDNGEAKLQVAFINWMRVALPHVLVWHVYNETGRDSHGAQDDQWAAIEGKRKKDRGVLAGVHDNHLAWPGRNFATIELKSPNKKYAAYSDSQARFAKRLDACGFPHFCCQTGQQIEAAIRSLGLVPLYEFPRALTSTKRHMMMREVFDAMHGDY